MSQSPVINAIVDALAELGVRHIEMPATPERVWRAIREANGRRKVEFLGPPQIDDATPGIKDS